MFAASKSGSADAKDPQFNYVTMLLHGNGTNGAQNNTFLDSSTNNFTITRNGNTTQGTFSPYGSNWSNYFDGSGDYLSVTGSALNASTTTDYTVEFWMYTAKTASTQMIYELGTGVTNDLQIYISTTALVFQVDGNTPTATVSFTDNSWVHVACVKASGTLTTYINGVGTTVDTGVTVTSKTTAYIGMRAGTSLPFTGYLSNMRVTRAAVYTSNFTPSTTPLTAIANTALLTCQSNRFIDNSASPLTITVNGNTSVQRFSPFSPTTAYSTSVIGGSGYFDGSGDYLSTTASSVTGGDFTIEAWVYLTSTSASAHLFSFGTNEPNRFSIYRDNANNKWSLAVVNGGSYTITAATSTAIANAWNHVAWVRSGSTNYLCVNGVREASNTASLNSGTSRYIAGNFGGSLEPITGYISDFRVSTSALYTGTTYTVPTAPFSAGAGTNMLLSYTNAGILDNAMMNDLETVGNAQISTSVKKYGTGSMYFDGTGDYLTVPSSPNLTFGSGDFTIEFWLYLTSLPLVGLFFSIYDNRPASQGAYPLIYVDNTTGTLKYWVSSADRITGSNLSSATWYHIAVSRSSGSTKMFVNGTQVGSTYTDTTTYLQSYLTVGANALNTSLSNLNGYIDDLRVTKGVARYTSNFTAPTAAFADKG